ncbi:M23 family metallopeptidase [Thermomonas paludicola]|uniref:M23 family metallopeptidase n=1 Tax=Thermomonas paludicola TaxID=2884874 RepID=UPI0021156C9C|nr:peptidoglycan DD-metalloendopeptidase family protein [Thermomonas paludicola]
MRPCLILVLACLCCVASAGSSPPANSTDAIARLRIEPGNGEYLAWADNRLAGPIEVQLDAAGGPAPASQPALPARASVPAGGSALLARLQPPAGRDGWLRLRLQGVPGSSNARPQDVAYLLPLPGEQAGNHVEQGFDGGFSHQDAENRYALDFAAAVGTPVLAARAGIVMQIQDGYREHGLDYARDAGRANFIRILHEDGSMALYAHLANAGTQVHLGQQVQAGQRIGLSGNTGYSTAPHLHFSVQVNRGMQLQSIRFHMPGVEAGAGAGAERSSNFVQR